MRSASPRAMIRKESPIEWVLDAQAVAVAEFGPRLRYLIETYPAASLMMMEIRKKGETRSGPLSSKVLGFLDQASPPIPEPM
jgi:hypothetical protein